MKNNVKIYMCNVDNVSFYQVILYKLTIGRKK